MAKKLNNTSSGYKKKEHFIEYHFSNNDEGKNKTFFNMEIDTKKTQSIFVFLLNKYGNEKFIIRDYSTYKYKDIELKVYPDGSSYCHRITELEINDNSLNNIIILNKERYKISNDNFPCFYKNDSSKDIIDIIFNITNEIKIILSTIYENNESAYTFECKSKPKSIDNIGKSFKINSTNNCWCEIYIKVEVNDNINNHKENINDIISMLQQY